MDMNEVINANSYPEDFKYTLNLRPGHFNMLFTGVIRGNKVSKGMSVDEAKLYLDKTWLKLCDKDRLNARKFFADIYGREYHEPAGAYADNSKLIVENKKLVNENSDLAKRLAAAEAALAKKNVVRTFKPKQVKKGEE